MKRIVLITNITPASENIRGTSALPYHLMVNRAQDIEIVIYSFNFNHLSREKIASVEQELNVKIVLLPLPRCISLLLRLKTGLLVRAILRMPLHYYVSLRKRDVEAIRAYQPHGIWIYGEEMSGIARQFAGIRRVHTLPDSEALFYYRKLGKRFVFRHATKMLTAGLMYRKYLRLEQSFECGGKMWQHVVGKADADFLRQVNPLANAVFLRHPHYALAVPQKTIRFGRNKIKLLIAGQYNFYMQQAADELVQELSRPENASRLTAHYSITFLGRGWQGHVRTLCAAGYEAEHITFAEDYIKEVCRHDIQITPIAIGTGTKGKVLDALANGLLVIGTPYALENIAVENGKSCIAYHESRQAVRVLLDIPKHVSRYEQMAENGRQQVLAEHAREKCAKELFSLLY